MKLLKLMCLQLLLVFSLLGVDRVWADLPANAPKYLPILIQEQLDIWPNHPDPAVMAAQVEKETCITLKHSRCWAPNAELKTSREYGFGFGQTTVAYDAQGKERFNTWRELRARYRTRLADWTWENRYDPRMQLRAMVLYDNQIYNNFGQAATRRDQLAFSLAAYNGGTGGTLKEIRVCGVTKGCDPTRWFGHVETIKLKSTKPWQGYGKSAWEINRDYPQQIMGTKVVKYRPYYEVHYVQDSIDVGR